MCTPLALGALALTAVGTVAGAAGQHKAYNAQTDARNAEQLRRQNYQNESQKYFNQNLGQSDLNATNENLATNTASNTAALNAVNGTADVRAPIAENIPGAEGPKVINTELGNRLSQANKFNTQQGAAKGRLDSYGDWTLGNQLNNLKTSNQIGLQGNFMQGSAGVLPWEMQDASHRGDSLKGLGTILSSLGSVAGLGASMGVGAPAVAAPGSGVANSAQLAAGAGGNLGYGGVGGLGPSLSGAGLYSGAPMVIPSAGGYLNAGTGLTMPSQFLSRAWSVR